MTAKKKKIIFPKSHLFIPSLIPDEFWIGYFGRILMANSIKDIPTIQKANPYFNGLFGNADYENIKASMSYKLALMSQTPYEEFIQHHTLIPLLITRNSYHYSPTKKPVVFNEYARKIMKKGAFFCKKCTEEDIDKYGISSWKRSHQLIGVDWCLKHHCGLFIVYKEYAMNQPPCRYLKSHKNLIYEINDESGQNRFIKKFINIIQYLSVTGHNFDYSDISSLINYQFNELIYNSLRPSDTLLSDFLIEKLPKAWVERNFPELKKNAAGEFNKDFDKIIKDDPKLINVLLIASVIFQNLCSLPYKLTRNIPSLKKAIDYIEPTPVIW